MNLSTILFHESKVQINCHWKRTERWRYIKYLWHHKTNERTWMSQRNVCREKSPHVWIDLRKGISEYNNYIYSIQVCVQNKPMINDRDSLRSKSRSKMPLEMSFRWSYYSTSKKDTSPSLLYRLLYYQVCQKVSYLAPLKAICDLLKVSFEEKYLCFLSLNCVIYWIYKKYFCKVLKIA